MGRNLAYCSCCLLLAAAAHAQQPIGELYASDASVRGSLVLAATGTQIMSGSQLSAGSSAAVLKLTRGGELRVCPTTGLALSASDPGPQLLVGLNTGQLEISTNTAAITDTVLTPDFRIQLTGPGRFHVAIGSDSRGNTCVHSLPGNESAVIVNETMGTGTYQVRPGASVLFPEGKLTGARNSDGSCGCPAPPPQVLQAKAVPPSNPAGTIPVHIPDKDPNETATTETSHVEMDSPFVFHGERAVPTDAIAMSSLRTRDLAPTALKLQPSGALRKAARATASDSARADAGKQRGFFGHIGHFFAKVFGKG